MNVVYYYVGDGKVSKVVLLFIDMMGVRYRWRTEGRTGAQHAFDIFSHLIRKTLAEQTRDSVVAGGVESDSAALICSDLGAASKIARELFCSAFLIARTPSAPRIWLRGVIVHAGEEVNLRWDEPLAQGQPQVTMSKYSSPLLDAIAIEKCGFKGMRVLLTGGPELGEKTRFRQVNLRLGEGTKRFCPFRRIQGLGYPGRLPNGYADFLWMACESEEEWAKMKATMVQRLKWAAGNQDEVAHAAATQVVFHHCGAFLQSVKQSKQRKHKIQKLLKSGQQGARRGRR
jgi:hypothetical protein